MVSLTVHLKIDSFNVRMFGFVLGTAYGIKRGNIEMTDLVSLLCTSERSKITILVLHLVEALENRTEHDNTDGLLDGMSLV